MINVDAELRILAESLPVSPEQQFALDIMREQHDDNAVIYETVNLVTREEDFLEARNAVEERYGFRGVDPESRIMASFAASTAWINALYRGIPHETEINEFSLQFVKSVKERFAAQSIVHDSSIRNLPDQQLLQLTDRMLQDVLKVDPSGKELASFRDFVVPIYFLKRFRGFLSSIDVNPRKEVRSAQQLAIENDGLFAVTRSLQKYGLKDVYVSETTPIGIKDWHVYDWQKRVARVAESNGKNFRSARPRSLARFSGFENPLINGASREILVNPISRDDVTSDNSASALIYQGLVQSKPNQIQPDLICDLYEDGQLHSPEGLPLKEFCQSLGMEVQYELMRARVLAIFTDLVIPAYLIDESGEISQVDKQATSASRVQVQNFIDLIVARLRLIQSEPDLEKKIDKAEKDENKFLRRHEVVGFIRKLPLGQRASQEARDKCLKDQGLVLADHGETYVSEHERGGIKGDEVNPIEGHRSVIRHIGGSVISRNEEIAPAQN